MKLSTVDAVRLRTEILGLQELPALAFDYPEDELFETAEGYVSGRQDGRGLRGGLTIPHHLSADARLTP